MTPAATTAAQEGQAESSVSTAAATAVSVIVCLGPAYENAPAEQLEPVLNMLREALSTRTSTLLLAYPVTDANAAAWKHVGVALQPYLPSAQVHSLATQTATAFLALFELMRAHSAHCGLLCGAHADTLSSAAVTGMIDSVCEQNTDLAVPRYALSSNDALLNAAILSPLSRSLFGAPVQFPLALDIAVSFRMAEKLAGAAQRCTTASQPEGLVWPVSEAAVAGYSIAEVAAGPREIPHPPQNDLTAILTSVAGSLFGDIEAKATFWQRVRPAAKVQFIGTQRALPPSIPVADEERTELIESFRLGYRNLHELWAMVLPPQTLLGLKRLSVAPPETFAVSDALWARILFDFVLAHRLRTINRGHLFGAFTPLYLAWVASHVAQRDQSSAETLARAFETDKPYLVSRWRWPDRFNP